MKTTLFLETERGGVRQLLEHKDHLVTRKITSSCHSKRHQFYSSKEYPSLECIINDPFFYQYPVPNEKIVLIFVTFSLGGLVIFLICKSLRRFLWLIMLFSVFTSWKGCLRICEILIFFCHLQNHLVITLVVFIY